MAEDRAALRRAYREALRLHEERRPRLDPWVDTLEARDRYEAAYERWCTEYSRLAGALRLLEVTKATSRSGASA